MSDNLEQRLKQIQKQAKENGIDITAELSALEKKIEESSATAKAWKKVELARKLERPGTLEYIKLISDEYYELHGDRLFGDDPAMVGGIARIGEHYVTFMGHQKGSNMKENIRRNYGMANPEGYRKALRLAKQAEKFGRPIVTFIDTQGAYPGIEAEERGIGEAIAQNLKIFAGLETPILCFVIGEGGSGGALGIGVGDKIYMLENAVYSVITPEGFASILFRDPAKAKDAANMMKITSEDLMKFKIVNGIIKEPEGGAHKDPQMVADEMKRIILDFIQKLQGKNKRHLVRYRNQKIQKIGQFHELHGGNNGNIK